MLTIVQISPKKFKCLFFNHLTRFLNLFTCVKPQVKLVITTGIFFLVINFKGNRF